MKWKGLKRNFLQGPSVGTLATLIAAPGFRLQPHGILGIGRYLTVYQIPEARKQVIATTFSRILPFYRIPNPVISSLFEFSL